MQSFSCSSHYDTVGNVVTDDSVKDDGFYQMGKARSYSWSTAGIVTDIVTGLEWKDDYSDNGGSIKYTNWDGALDYCPIFGLDNGGWRLPSSEELETLVDNGRYNPSVTENIFEHISSDYYWSTTTHVGYTSYAWSVHFSNGGLLNARKTNNGYVRCVRGGQLETSNFSRDDATEIVTDTTTGLLWQDNEIVVTTKRLWQEAIDYCENNMTLGGHNDWRPPNINELLSIADRTQWDPAIDIRYFFNISPDEYWSSTTLASTTPGAWLVYFSYGGSDYFVKTNTYYVRCVRGGQIDTSVSLPPVIMYLLD